MQDLDICFDVETLNEWMYQFYVCVNMHFESICKISDVFKNQIELANNKDDFIIF